MYSPRLSCTILLVNCMKGIGVPLLTKSFGELKRCYLDTKKAIKEDGPDLTKQIEKVTTLTKDLRAIEKSLTTSPELKDNAETLEKIKTDVAALAHASQETIQTGNRIRSKLDYSTFYRVAGDLYLLTLTAVATARSGTAANFSIGISIGNSITMNLKNFIKKYEDKIYTETKKLDDKLEASDNISQRIAGALLNPEETVANLNAAATVIGSSAGMMLSFYYSAFGRLLAASTLGAEIIVNGLEVLLDPLLIQYGVPTVGKNAVVVRSGLTYFGIFYNGLSLIHGYGWIANFIISPLLIVEAAACKVVADSVKY